MEKSYFLDISEYVVCYINYFLLQNTFAFPMLNQLFGAKEISFSTFYKIYIKRKSSSKTWRKIEICHYSDKLNKTIFIHNI